MQQNDAQMSHEQADSEPKQFRVKIIKSTLDCAKTGQLKQRSSSGSPGPGQKVNREHRLDQLIKSVKYSYGQSKILSPLIIVNSQDQPQNQKKNAEQKCRSLSKNRSLSKKKKKVKTKKYPLRNVEEWKNIYQQAQPELRPQNQVLQPIVRKTRDITQDISEKQAQKLLKKYSQSPPRNENKNSL